MPNGVIIGEDFPPEPAKRGLIFGV